MVRTGKWINEGWEAFSSDFWLLILVGIIFQGGALLSSTSQVGAILIMGPLICGTYAILLKKLRTNQTDIAELGAGFNIFWQAFLANLIISIFILIGFFLCLLPALALAVIYMFAFPVLVDKRLTFWEAMEASRKMVLKNFWGLLWFHIVLIVINCIGVCLCGVGVLVTLPLTMLAHMAAYRDLFEAESVLEVEEVKEGGGDDAPREE